MYGDHAHCVTTQSLPVISGPWSLPSHPWHFVGGLPAGQHRPTGPTGLGLVFWRVPYCQGFGTRHACIDGGFHTGRLQAPVAALKACG